MHRSLLPKLLTGILLLGGLSLHAVDSARNDRPVSSVTGESWLNHLHRSFGDTSMGKTGRLGPPPSEQEAQVQSWQAGLLAPSGPEITLRGQDLYRLNCRACHGENGLGAPPEINSIVDPVRATSAALMLERMKKRGMDITPAAATEMARQAQSSLMERLNKGGQSMPPFSQLNDVEVHALIEYVKQLSQTPGTAQVTLREAPVRVGELIVKSTCHICHDATGSNPTAAQLEDGQIPPLETLTSRTDEAQFIRKVTTGAPVLMGTPPTLHRGRMPVFFYLTREEAADIYLYLSSYPPSPLNAELPLLTATTQQSSGAGLNPPTIYSSSVRAVSPNQQPAATAVNWAIALIFLAAIGFGLSLLLLFCGLASYQLSRPRQSTLEPGELPIAIPSKAEATGSGIATANCRRT